MAESLALVVHPRCAHNAPLTIAPVHICELPIELLRIVGMHLCSGPDLCAIQQTCQFLRYVFRDDWYWKWMCQKQFGTPDLFVAATKLTWKEAYKMHRRTIREFVTGRCTQYSNTGSTFQPIILRMF